MSIKITPEFKEFIAGAPHIKKVYFAENGAYSFNAYTKDKKTYIALIDPALVPTASAMKSLEVTLTLSRKQILGPEPDKAPE